MIEFCPIASGSSGNCIYLSTPGAKILIDAGLSGIRIERALGSLGVDPYDLDAVFLTHEHGDHISGAGVMARRFGLKIFATAGTWGYIDTTGVLGRLGTEHKHLVYPEEDMIFHDIIVRPFNISHDAADPVGYSFFYGPNENLNEDLNADLTQDSCQESNETAYKAGSKATIVTDIGHICSNLYEKIADSDILLIESNHDIDMLKKGPYPFHLKKRILGEKGHLSNVSCGQTLTALAHRLKHIYLGHLSAENNDPLLAFETVRDILESASIPVNSPCGAGLNLYLADRHVCSKFLRV